MSWRHCEPPKKGSLKTPPVEKQPKNAVKDGDGRWNGKEIAVPRALESYYDVIALLVKSVHRLIQMY